MQNFLLVTIAAVVTAAGADNTTARLGKATAVLNKMTQSGDVPAGELAGADCIVVVPGFKKEPSLLVQATGGDSFCAGMVATGRHRVRLPWIAAAWAYSLLAKK
jgi:hypothetical protein